MNQKDLEKIFLKLKEIKKGLNELKSISEEDKKKKIEQDNKKQGK